MDGLEFWRNIALVFLLVQFFAVIVVGVALAYLLARVTANLHVYAQKGADKAQEIGTLVVEKSDEYAEKARMPVIKGNAAGAGIGAAARSLFSDAKKPSGAADSTGTNSSSGLQQ